MKPVRSYAYPSPVYYRTEDGLDAGRVVAWRREHRSSDAPWHLWRLVWLDGSVEYVVTHGCPGEECPRVLRDVLPGGEGIRAVMECFA